MNEHVTHAQNVEKAETVVNAGHIETVDHVILTPPSKANRLRLLYIIVGALIIAAASAFVGSAISRQIAASSAKAQAATACYDLYSAQVGVANADVLATQGELFTKAFYQTSTDPDARRAELTPTVIALQKATVALRSAVAARDAYSAAGRPLPCPIK